jgi:hypothetical protein
MSTPGCHGPACPAPVRIGGTLARRRQANTALRAGRVAALGVDVWNTFLALSIVPQSP